MKTGKVPLGLWIISGVFLLAAIGSIINGQFFAGIFPFIVAIVLAVVGLLVFRKHGRGHSTQDAQNTTQSQAPISNICPVQSKQQNNTEATRDSYFKQYIEEQKQDTKPVLFPVDATGKFYSYQGKKFDFSHMSTDGTFYLLDGEVGGLVWKDMRNLDPLFAQANEIATNLPSFQFPSDCLAIVPVWSERSIKWFMCHIIPQPLTKTGNYPKYPLRVLLYDQYEHYEADVKYDQNDQITTGNITVKDDTGMSYRLYFGNGEIKRITRHVGAETFPIFTS